jgi:hypothetical protein
MDNNAFAQPTASDDYAQKPGGVAVNWTDLTEDAFMGGEQIDGFGKL